MDSEPTPLFLSDENLALATDLYQLTMAAGYVAEGMAEPATFEMFVRRLPPRRGYLVVAGLEQAVHGLLHMRFSDEAVAWLRGQDVFGHVGEGFFDYLRAFRFRGDVDAMPEGTLAFAGEPLVRVTAPLPDAQLVETFLLTCLNYPTLVATKAARVVDAAAGRPVVDFGTRRAHGPQAALLAARAAYIGGCVGTSNVLAGRQLGIRVFGTQAHSWVMAHPTEEEAFLTYHNLFPDHTTLLIDTYDTLAGARKAAQVGPAVGGVRLDSGDLAALSKGVRRILDRAGLRNTRILASSDLNEYRIAELVRRRAPIDAFGVGTEMVTSADAPALSGVYKLVEQRVAGRDVPRVKQSAHKATYPGRKQVWRRRDKRGRLLRDLIALADETHEGEPLLAPILRNGTLVAPLPALDEARDRAAQGLELLPPRFRRLDEPAEFPVRRSPRLDALLAQAVDQQRGARHRGRICAGP